MSRPLKIRFWTKSRDAMRCSGCAAAFKRGDKVVTDCALTIHARADCVKKYQEIEQELQEEVDKLKEKS